MENLYDVCVQNFLRNLSVKEFCKLVYICLSYDQKTSLLVFFDLQCVVVYRDTWLDFRKLESWAIVRSLDPTFSHFSRTPTCDFVYVSYMSEIVIYSKFNLNIFSGFGSMRGRILLL